MQSLVVGQQAAECTHCQLSPFPKSVYKFVELIIKWVPDCNRFTAVKNLVTEITFFCGQKTSFIVVVVVVVVVVVASQHIFDNRLNTGFMRSQLWLSSCGLTQITGSIMPAMFLTILMVPVLAVDTAHTCVDVNHHQKKLAKLATYKLTQRLVLYQAKLIS